MDLKRKIHLMSRTVSAALSSAPEGMAEILAQGGKLNSCTPAQLPERIYLRTEQNLNITPYFFQQKLPVHNPVWQVNAASQVPEPVSGDLQRPHRNFHFLFTTSVQHVPGLGGFSGISEGISIASETIP